MRRAAIALLTVLLVGPVSAQQAPVHMISSKGVAKLLAGNAFQARAQNGTVGTITFGTDGHVTFKGRTLDQGVYRISETGYCSKWQSTKVTQCFTMSPLRGHGRYQVWTVYGERRDVFTALATPRAATGSKTIVLPNPKPEMAPAGDMR